MRSTEGTTQVNAAPRSDDPALASAEGGPGDRVSDRRAFLGTLAGGLLAAPLAADAQQRGTGYRIGWIGNDPPDASRPFGAFRQGLGELGWVEGRNIVIEHRHSAGRSERFPGLAVELVRLQVDLIVASAAPATLAAKRATTTIPIVGVGLSDPVGQGLAASLVRPGGNVTGLASLFPELAAKRL